jgi:hypothetical protein
MGNSAGRLHAHASTKRLARNQHDEETDQDYEPVRLQSGNKCGKSFRKKARFWSLVGWKAIGCEAALAAWGM